MLFHVELKNMIFAEQRIEKLQRSEYETTDNRWKENVFYNHWQFYH